MVFKALHGLSPPYISNEYDFKKDLNIRTTTKSEHDVYIAPYTTATKEKSVFIKSGKLWNTLPHSIKCIESLDTFKKECKQHIMKTS